MNILLKIKSIKRIVSNKSLSYKLDFQEEVGIHKIKEFIEISFLRKLIRILKLIFSLGTISAVMTIISFVFPSDNSIALTDYQRGVNYLEDQYYEDAEKCFERAYKINSDLFNIKYYYAYTEFMLDKFDKSHKILVENKDSLDENEMVVLAMYEYKSGNHEKSKLYMNKILEPENLDKFAFCEYIDFATKLGFLDDYDKGLNVVCNNLMLLETRIFPHKEIKFYSINGLKPEESQLLETMERIEKGIDKDNSKYIRTKLYMYLLFIYYSIQYENYEVPTRYFSDMAETLDFANHSDITRQLLYVLYIYASELTFNPEMPEEMKEAYSIVSEKYYDLKLLEKENIIEIEENDKKMFEIFENLSKDINNNTFDPKNYSFLWWANFKYSEDNILKEWARTMDKWVDYKGK